MLWRSGSWQNRREDKPYRKSRPLPALLVIGVLGGIATLIWTNAIASDIENDIRCRPEARPPSETTYLPLSHEDLDGVTLTPPERIPVRVLNANRVHGQAALATEALEQLGFTQTASPRDDQAFSHEKATCHGQLRFGENGFSAARTLWLIDPCLELIRDDRDDASVHLSIGTLFNGVQPPSEAQQILEDLDSWSADNTGNQGGARPFTDQDPVISEERLEHVEPEYC